MPEIQVVGTGLCPRCGATTEIKKTTMFLFDDEENTSTIERCGCGYDREIDFISTNATTSFDHWLKRDLTSGRISQIMRKFFKIIRDYKAYPTQGSRPCIQEVSTILKSVEFLTDYYEIYYQLSIAPKEITDICFQDTTETVNAARADAMFGGLSSGMAEFYDNDIRGSRSEKPIRLIDNIIRLVKQEENDFRIEQSIRAENEFLSKLKEKVGQKISILMKSSVTAEASGNIGPFTKPRESELMIKLNFFGIYGLAKRTGLIGQRLVYIYGLDENGQEKMIRSNSDLTVDEDTGCINFDSHDSIAKIDDLEVGSKFSSWLDNDAENLIKDRLAKDGLVGYDLENQTKALTGGQPSYRPRVWVPSFSIFEESMYPKFIEQIKKYFDKIV